MIVHSEKETFRCAVVPKWWSVTVDHWAVICVIAPRLRLDIGLAVVLPCGLDVATFSTPFNKDMSLQHILAWCASEESLLASAHLQCVFPREALVTMVAWERLHGEMDPLMPLQVVVPIEALRTLVAFKRSFDVGRLWCLWWLTAIQALWVRGKATVVARRYHALLHATYHGHLPIWTVDIRHHRARHGREGVRGIRWTDEMALTMIMAARRLAHRGGHSGI
jgi:hypothetical protein